MKQYFEDLLTTINDSVRSLNEAQFSAMTMDAQNTLNNGHKLVVSGLGKNVPVCEKFVGTMNSVGLAAVYMNTNSAIHGDLGVVCDGDMVIVLTKSGETSESVHLIDLLRERNANIWLLTFTENSQIEKKIGSEKTLVLSLDSEGDKWNVVPNNSTTVNLIILQGLAMTLVDIMNIPLSRFKMNHPGGYIGAQLKNA